MPRLLEDCDELQVKGVIVSIIPLEGMPRLLEDCDFHLEGDFSSLSKYLEGMPRLLEDCDSPPPAKAKSYEKPKK